MPLWDSLEEVLLSQRRYLSSMVIRRTRDIQLGSPI